MEANCRHLNFTGDLSIIQNWATRWLQLIKYEKLSYPLLQGCRATCYCSGWCWAARKDFPKVKRWYGVLTDKKAPTITLSESIMVWRRWAIVSTVHFLNFSRMVAWIRESVLWKATEHFIQGSITNLIIFTIPRFFKSLPLPLVIDRSIGRSVGQWYLSVHEFMYLCIFSFSF